MSYVNKVIIITNYTHQPYHHADGSVHLLVKERIANSANQAS